MEKEKIEVIKPKTFIERQVEAIKEKTNLMTDTITNKLFDTNLLTALREDLHKLDERINDVREQYNEIAEGEIFLFQMLDEIRIELNRVVKTDIKIPNHIKKHFRV
jgi:hypothetical protein